MSEPGIKAETLETVAPGVRRWHLIDDRIDFESDAYAVAAEAAGAAGSVLIDPLPLAARALKALEPVVAICLTAACHQRSAWRYRERFGVEVYAPKGSRAMEAKPDVRYRAGDLLPGGLRAVPTPGPERAHYAFLREGRPGVLFCADLVMRVERGRLEFVPPAYHDDPEATRESVRRLLDLDFSVLCLAHGPPLRRDPKAALARLLARTA